MTPQKPEGTDSGHLDWFSEQVAANHLVLQHHPPVRVIRRHSAKWDNDL